MGQQTLGMHWLINLRSLASNYMVWSAVKTLTRGHKSTLASQYLWPCNDESLLNHIEPVYEKLTKVGNKLNWLRQVPSSDSSTSSCGPWKPSFDFELHAQKLTAGSWLGQVPLLTREVVAKHKFNFKESPLSKCVEMCRFEKVGHWFRVKIRSYPLVICYIAIENGPVEIVDLPIDSMVIFHSFLLTFTGWFSINHGDFPCDLPIEGTCSQMFVASHMFVST